jgi:hypothetical protein
MYIKWLKMQYSIKEVSFLYFKADFNVNFFFILVYRVVFSWEIYESEWFRYQDVLEDVEIKCALPVLYLFIQRPILLFKTLTPYSDTRVLGTFLILADPNITL